MNILMVYKKIRSQCTSVWDIWSTRLIWSEQENCALQRNPKKAKIQHISKAFQCNNHPWHFIQKSIHRTIPSSSERQRVTSIKLPYEPGTGEAIKRILQRVGIRVLFNSPNTIGRFLGSEINKIPTINRGDVVYKISCQCGTGYICLTGRSLYNRIDEQNQIRSNKDEQNPEEKSAIALHAITTGHTVAFESAQSVITNVRNPLERLAAKQLTIKATEKKNCYRKDA